MFDPCLTPNLGSTFFFISYASISVFAVIFFSGKTIMGILLCWQKVLQGFLFFAAAASVKTWNQWHMACELSAIR